MSDKIELEIVTPERRVVSEVVDEVVLPSELGYMGVRPGHAPLLTRLQAGEVSYNVDGGERILAISGGFAEVLHHRLSILAETCEPVEEIDVERAKSARDRAETRLKAQAPETEFERAAVSLRRAINRISAHRRGKV